MTEKWNRLLAHKASFTIALACRLSCSLFMFYVCIRMTLHLVACTDGQKCRTQVCRKSGDEVRKTNRKLEASACVLVRKWKKRDRTSETKSKYYPRIHTHTHTHSRQSNAHTRRCKNKIHTIKCNCQIGLYKSKRSEANDQL